MQTKKERLDALLREMEGLQAISDSLTEEQSKRYDAALVEAESLKAQIARDERAAALSAELRASAGRKVPDAPAGETRSTIEVGEPDGGKPLFRNLGEFVESLTRKDERFQKYLNGADAPAGAKRDYSPVVTGDAGASFLIPANLHDQLLKLDPLAEIIAPRATVIPAGDQPDAQDKWPVMLQGTSGVFAGVNFTWSTEGQATAPVANPGVEVVTLTPHEVIGTWQVSQKVLRNASAYSGLITDTFQQAFSAMRDRAFITGAGTTLPLGILNSACKVTVNRDTVNVLKFADVVALRAAMHPNMLKDAIWIAATDARPQLEAMVDGGNRYIWGPGDIAAGRPETLMGLPLFFYDHAALGAAADLALVVPKTYLYKQGFGPALALSEHASFTSGLVVFRLVASFDGACWVQDPLTLGNSHIVSPVVTLKATTS